jgi:phage tail sheath protein FI
MATFKTPGVFIQEIPTLPASIAPVATAIPAFIGYTEKAEEKGNDLTNIPTRITSFLEFEELFGGPEKVDIDVTIDDSGATRVINSSVTESDHILNHAMRHYFANGGGPCWIVSVGESATGGFLALSASELVAGVEAVAKEDEPTLLVVPEAVYLSDTDQGVVMSACLTQCNTLQDRFTIMDVDDDGDIEADALAFRDDVPGNDYLKYGAAYYPFLNTTIEFSYDDDDVTILHIPAGVSGEVDLNGTLTSLKDDDLQAYNQVVAEISASLRVTLPPSATMAGIYARVDRDRGVFKAPANVSISNVIGPNMLITAAEQENLNVDVVAGKSINAIRTFTGKGTLVWGARTLAGNDNEWRYVPVRRFFIFAEESIQKATEFVVFEPNDANTWLRVKTMITNFLTEQWRVGALAGAAPSDAFFVNVGLGETMTAQDILEGRMIVEIGMAAVRPAEFIILRFSHKLQES